MRKARLLADRLASEILGHVGLPLDRPIDIDEVAARLGVQMTSNEGLRTEGRLISTAAGPVIEYRASRPAARRRFTKAHELAHWWLARPQPSPLTRLTQAAFVSEEELCDTLAAALLIPRSWLVQHVQDEATQGANQNLDFLTAWSHEAGVSRQAMAIRFRDVFAWPLILLTWEKSDRWRYTGESAVRPWEFGQIRPAPNIARDHLPQAAPWGGWALPPREIDLHISGTWQSVLAEIAADHAAGYALISNPFAPPSRNPAAKDRHPVVARS